jgi:hypothetical protein
MAIYTDKALFCHLRTSIIAFTVCMVLHCILRVATLSFVSRGGGLELEYLDAAAALQPRPAPP